LREVAAGNEPGNRYYDWAAGHRDYHLAGQANGARLLADFVRLFDSEVGDLTPARLVTACLRSDLRSPLA
jgi:hypothetical protein